MTRASGKMKWLFTEMEKTSGARWGFTSGHVKSEVPVRYAVDMLSGHWVSESSVQGRGPCWRNSQEGIFSIWMICKRGCSLSRRDKRVRSRAQAV